MDAAILALLIVGTILLLPYAFIIKLWRRQSRLKKELQQLQAALSAKQSSHNEPEQTPATKTSTPTPATAQAPTLTVAQEPSQTRPQEKKKDSPPVEPQTTPRTPPPLHQHSSTHEHSDTNKSAEGLLQRLHKIAISIGLLPPADMQKKEAFLMQWWAPRIGGLFGLLAAIFFAVYVGRNSSPWIRLVELLIADAIIIGLGARFWKSRPQLGISLLSTGLAILYFTSMAAYMAAPIKVIHNPLWGIATSGLTILLIYVIGLRLTHRGIVILATLFAYISSIFAAWEGFREASLISSLFVFALSIIFLKKLRWLPVFAIAGVGVYLPIFAYAWLGILSPELLLPSSSFTLAYLGVTLTLFLIPNYLWGQQLLTPTTQRILLSLHTSLTLVSGYLFFKINQPEALVHFYGTATLVFIGHTLLYLRRGTQHFAYQLLFIKASALASLWILHTYSGDIRWLALGSQSVVLAFSAKQSRSACIAALAWLTQMLSLAICLAQWPQLPVIHSISWLLYLSYPALLAISHNWLQQSFPHKAAQVAWGLTPLSAAAVLTAFIAQSNIYDETRPLYHLAYLVLLLAISRLPSLKLKPLLPLLALTFIAAHLIYWFHPHSLISLLLLLLATGLALTAAIKKNISNTTTLITQASLHLLWVTSLFTYGQSHPSILLYLPFLLGALLWLIAITTPSRIASLFTLWPLLLYFISPSSSESVSTTLIAITLQWSLFTLLPSGKPCKQFLEQHTFCRGYPYLATGLLWAWSLSLSQDFSWSIQIAITLALSSAYLLYQIKQAQVSLLIATTAGAIIASTLFIQQYLIISEGLAGLQLPWATHIIGYTLWLSTLWVLISLNLNQHRYGTFSQQLVAISAVISYIVWAIGWHYPPIDIGSYYTALLALASTLLILIGIARSLKSFRLIGVITLLIPIGRLFLYDIQDTLMRIIAFAIIALLLSGIGYLYHRFQSKIE